MIEIKWQPDRRFLRQFAVLLLIFFPLFAAYQYSRGLALETAALIGVIGGAVGAVGFLVPAALRYVYLGWMLAVFPIGWVLSHVILAAIFYLVVTPVGVIMRLCGRDPMRRAFDPNAESYWIRRSPEGDSRRYFRQF